MKTERVNLRIRKDVLDAFDHIVGEGQRSKAIRGLMEQEIIKSNKFTKIHYGYGQANYEFHLRDTGDNRS